MRENDPGNAVDGFIETREHPALCLHQHQLQTRGGQRRPHYGRLPPLEREAITRR
jgi:hypothetical protein